MPPGRVRGGARWPSKSSKNTTDPSGGTEIVGSITSGSAVSTAICGSEADACREAMLRPSLTGVTSTKLYVPFPCTAAVTSNST
jgi:hypothetical protein